MNIKPLIAAGAASIAMLGLIVLLHRSGRYESAAEPQPTNLIATLTERALAEADRDSDSDGLEDWEEILWKSDARNADTDGDGAKDGDEAGAGRDPTVAGPDDKIAVAPASEAPSGVSEGLQDDGSATAAVGKELMSQYVALKQAGGEVDEETAKRLAEGAVSSIAETRLARTYTTGDIVISERDSKQALREYGNEMGAIITRFSPPAGYENEITVFMRALMSDNKEEIVKLDPLIAGYRAITDAALVTPVPLSASILHLRLVNGFARYSATIAGLRALFTDPLTALLSLNAVQKDAPELLRTMEDVERFFRERGVEYARGEDGYAFAHALAGVDQGAGVQ